HPYPGAEIPGILHPQGGTHAAASPPHWHPPPANHALWAGDVIDRHALRRLPDRFSLDLHHSFIFGIYSNAETKNKPHCGLNSIF
ncbi:MAG: hypothetical protein GY786_06555, partial [Proteobacteria bacterium]|nr:hypothetical protein [Pseudomonadota bacterium]